MDLGEGRRPTIRGTLERGAAVFAAVLGVLILYWLATAAGFIALIIPGIYVMIRLWVAPQSVVVEDRRGADALRRSWDLVKDNWWRVFGIVIVTGLIGGIAAAILYVPGELVAAETGSGPISLAGQMVGDAITYSFQALVGTLLFFDLRARKTWTGHAWAQPPAGYQAPPPAGYPPRGGPERPVPNAPPPPPPQELQPPPGGPPPPPPGPEAPR
jgi:hypothetical protein